MRAPQQLDQGVHTLTLFIPTLLTELSFLGQQQIPWVLHALMGCLGLCPFLVGQSQVGTKPVLRFTYSDSLHKKMDSEKLAQLAKAT